MAVHGPRNDVWTDAGRESGNLFRIAQDVSATTSYRLLDILGAQGWTVELRDPTPLTDATQEPS